MPIIRPSLTSTGPFHLELSPVLKEQSLSPKLIGLRDQDVFEKRQVSLNRFRHTVKIGLHWWRGNDNKCTGMKKKFWSNLVLVSQ
jgi:hypothetical protein